MINQENHGNKIFGRSNVPTVQLGSTLCMSYSNPYVIIKLVLFCGCSDTNCLWLSRTSFVIPVEFMHLRDFIVWIFWPIRNFLQIYVFLLNITVRNNLIVLKFKNSEKATKFCEISTLLLFIVHTDKSKVEISQNLSFSEYMNRPVYQL